MLKSNIQDDFNKVLKEKKEIDASVLKMLKAAILNKEKEKRFKLSKEKPGLSESELEKESALSDNEVVEVVFSEIKKRKESIELFKKGKREDLVTREKAELEILKKYLPEQISEKELKELAIETIKKLGAKDIKDLGTVMKELMPKLKGKAEGSEVSRMVKELLSQNS